jgi:hypothetical protein
MSDIKRSFTDKFCNDHSGDRVRWLRSVAFDMPDLLEQVLAWLDERSKWEDNLTDRIIELEDENTKLKNALGEILWNREFEGYPPWDSTRQDLTGEFVKKMMEDI